MEEKILPETERSEIRKKMLRLIAGKGTGTLPPQKFKDFICLVRDFVTGTKECEDDLYLPDDKNPAIHIEFAESVENDDFVNISILNGLGKESGETVTLTESDGKLLWCIGISDSFYSKLLERVVFLGDNADYIMSEEPLTPAECQKLAKLIYSYLPQ